MADILIVDDEEKIGKLLAAELSDAGHRARSTASPEEGLELIESTPPDILLTDLRMGQIDGITLLRKAKQVAPATDVIIMTAYASIETALETMKEGAYDYIAKPFNTEELLLLVQRLEEKRRLQDENAGLRSYISTTTQYDIVGASPAITGLKNLITNLAHSNAAVLIRGESGTGKELVAKAIHRVSPHASGPFIAINCAAIPETLLESELFGYERGAFTGATHRKLGHFELANGGTLFLDEIGDLPQSLQAKLLRVLEDLKIRPLGGQKDIQLDIRVISATNRRLESAIEEGSFRQDLYYRLNVFPLDIPPLRDRPEDIEKIAEHFLNEFGGRGGDLGADALKRLVSYNWPGNVRELRNVLERATILKPAGMIEAADIVLENITGVNLHTGGEATTSDSLDIAEAEKRLILKALERASGNKSEAARMLGITRRALYGRLDRYGIEHDD